MPDFPPAVRPAAPAACPSAAQRSRARGPDRGRFGATRGALAALCALICLAATAARSGPFDLRAQTDISRTLTATTHGAVAPAVDAALAVHRPRSKLDAERIYLSSLGPQHLPQAWVSVHGTRFGGSQKGHAAGVTMGVDARLHGRMRVGVLASARQASVRRKDLAVEVDAAAIGPYFARRLQSQARLTGWLLVARPRYTLGGESWRANRWTGALAFERSFAPGAAEVTTQARLSTHGEAHPGNTVLSLKGHAEGKVTFRPQAKFRPHLGLKLDMDLRSDGIEGRKSDTDGSLDAGMRFVHERTRIGLGITSYGGDRPALIKAELSWRF